MFERPKPPFILSHQRHPIQRLPSLEHYLPVTAASSSRAEASIAAAPLLGGRRVLHALPTCADRREALDTLRLMDAKRSSVLVALRARVPAVPYGWC